MSKFSGRVDVFLDEFFHLFPVAATAMGMHAVDGEWPDLSPVGRAARLAFADRWETELHAFAEAALTQDERIDRDLLLSELAALRFDETELREDAWDALGYVYLLGGGIFPLLARDFAPLPVRLASVASRLARAWEAAGAAAFAASHGDRDQAAAGDRGSGRGRRGPGRRGHGSGGSGCRRVRAAGSRPDCR